MKIFATTAAAAMALVATAAHAQSGTSAFTGPFVGVQGGWEENSVNNPTTGVGVTPLTHKGDTGTLGVIAGYDYQLAPHVVVGGQAELNFPFSDHITDGTNVVEAKRSIDLSLRAGYVVGDKTLVYGRAGYVNERVGATIGGDTPVVASGSQNGWQLGAGVERAVTQHVSARIEYRYTDLSEGDGKWDRHQVLVGAAYRF